MPSHPNQDPDQARQQPRPAGFMATEHRRQSEGSADDPGDSAAELAAVISGLPETPAIETRQTLVKAGVLLGVVLLGALAYRLTPVRTWLEPAGELAAWARRTGWWGVLAFYGASTGLIFAGVPRLLFCPIAGALYGFWGGLALCMLSPSISYFTTFLLVRGRRRPDTRVVLPRRLAFLGRNPGFAGVVLARLIPLPGMVITLALSLSTVSRTSYLLGTMVGLIPEAAPLVLLGCGLLHPGPQSYVHFAVIAVLLVGSFWFALRYYQKRQREAAAEPGR